MKRTEIKDVLKCDDFGSQVNVKGWVRTKRGSKNVSFIALNDGSTIKNVQVVVDHLVIGKSMFGVPKSTKVLGSKDFAQINELLGNINTGTALSVTGDLVESPGGHQKVEVYPTNIEILGMADPKDYPLQPKKHSLEFLREKAHLRYRTNTFSAIARIRHAMIFAIHKFFNDKGFYNIHSPIITGSDAEGAGEMFQVTTMDLNQIPKGEDGNVNFQSDFFGKATNLTVSGQLEAELAALALSKVYTFGPTFRAENSNTTRHLAEFWMIEPEVAFCDINDDMDLAEDMLKYVIRYALDNCKDDLEFLSKRLHDEEKNKKADERSMELIEKLNFVLDDDFVRITYTEAIQILRNSKPNKKKRFQYIIEGWGADLQSEHERYLVEKHFKKPVILTDYPREIKAFYMKQNDDGKTVRAMDVLFPQIGEIIGGSQREEDYEKLAKRMEEMEIPEESMWWYLETRKFGTVPHAGFGLGFERLILFLTGMGNIRDVIPFPRTPLNCEF
ncbi:MAG: asparagine--tRNA ligase [Bacteroidetes bacterium]|nr:MAG: asparagine--tRNA ligase [Bacteroidota bacterium]